MSITNISDTTKAKVDDLFAEAEECLNTKLKKASLIEIKDLMEQKKKAELMVANIDREIGELKLKIAHEIG